MEDRERSRAVHRAHMLAATDVEDAPGRYRLMTLRSNDQFNTTIYGYSDRLRGIEGTRDVVLMNAADIERGDSSAGQQVSLVGDAGDGHPPLDGPGGRSRSTCRTATIAGYYPELNPLIALQHHDRSRRRRRARPSPSASGPE